MRCICERYAEVVFRVGYYCGFSFMLWFFRECAFVFFVSKVEVFWRFLI